MSPRSSTSPAWLKKLSAKIRTTQWLASRRDAERYADYTAELLERRPFINVGAGKFSHRYWTNVDYGSDWYAKKQPKGFVHYDLTAEEPLPFETGSVELVYTSHTLEHVPHSAGQNFFRESHRVLREGGGVRITCPDSRLLFRSARDGRHSYWSWRHRWFLGPLSTAPDLKSVTLWDYLVREVATRRCRFYRGAVDPLQPEAVADAFSRLDYEEFMDFLTAGQTFEPGAPGDHICWWDEERIIAGLRAAGFEKIYVSRRGQSLFAPMTDEGRFDATQPNVSLFVEAVR